jgi:hypothetical protein
MICSSVCLLRFIVWSFPRARLQFTLDRFKGATSRRLDECDLLNDVQESWHCRARSTTQRTHPCPSGANHGVRIKSEPSPSMGLGMFTVM